MTPATSLNALPEPAPVVEFADGLGTRVRVPDTTGTDVLQMLRLRDGLVAVSSFDFALRERVSRLANFRHAYYARVRRVDRLDSGSTLGVIAEAPNGARLSRILEVAYANDLDLDINAALCLIRQVVPAIAMLHQNARDVSHGALAPERIVVTPNARAVIVDYVFGAAIESLGFGRDRLWKDLRVAVSPGAGVPRLNHRADVMQIGAVALALVLGRPLGDDDLTDPSVLLASATENSVHGDREPISDPLRRWLSRALQLDPRGSFESALEAQLALDDVLNGETGYVAAPVALETFLARYEECALLTPATYDDDLAEPAVPAPIVEVAQGTPFPRPAVPPPAAPLGVAKVADGMPAVPSFRAVAVPAPISSPQPPPAEPPVAAAPPGPVNAAVQQPASTPVLSPPVVPVTARPPAVPDHEAEWPVEDTPEDEEAALRAQFLAASAVQTPISSGAVPGWWRHVAIGALALAIAEGGFLGWRLQSAAGAPSASEGLVKIESKPVGAQIKVDGETKGATPLSLPLRAGAHVIEIGAGGEPRVIPITVNAGETLAQYVELSSGGGFGHLALTSEPAGATVLLDGQPRGVAPLDLQDVTPGEHELVLDLNGARVRRVITVTGGTSTTIAVPMSGASAVPASALPVAEAPAPTTGAIAVQVPFEMQVFEGAALLGVTSRKLTLSPGPHDLRIVSDTLEFKTSAHVEVVAGHTTRVPVTLPKGVIHLNATPWAEVWIDGEKIGETPIGNLPITIGPHEVVFKNPDLGEQSHAATVTAGTPLRLSVDLTKKNQ
jgi:hypothetical protein